MNTINAFIKNAKKFTPAKRIAKTRPFISGIHYNKVDYKKPLIAMTDSYIMTYAYPNADLPYKKKTVGIYDDIETNGRYPDLNNFIKDIHDFDTKATITLSNNLIKKVKSIWDISKVDGLLYINIYLEKGKLFLTHKSAPSNVKMSIGYTDDVNKEINLKIDGGYLYNTLKLFKDAGMLGSKITIGIKREKHPIYFFSDNITTIILPIN